MADGILDRTCPVQDADATSCGGLQTRAHLADGVVPVGWLRRKVVVACQQAAVREVARLPSHLWYFATTSSEKVSFSEDSGWFSREKDEALRRQLGQCTPASDQEPYSAGRGWGG